VTQNSASPKVWSDAAAQPYAVSPDYSRAAPFGKHAASLIYGKVTNWCAGTYAIVPQLRPVSDSAHQFMTAGFTETVAKILDRTSTDPGLLTLEVTQSVFVRDEQRAVVVLNEIKDIGVKLALDDFGTGYSSLGYLTTLPIDSIKIDRTFTAKLTHEPDSHRIVTAIIQLAHSLGMTVVSEGVETAGQHHELTQLGSDSCQGFYFARPMPATSLNTLIQHPRPAERPTPPSARRHQHSTGNIQSKPRYHPPATVDAVRQADARDQQCPTLRGATRLARPRSSRRLRTAFFRGRARRRLAAIT
jgi:EAL domain-containing protein (putative c-di-GMP-specific phosphodiesterase class I)